MLGVNLSDLVDIWSLGGMNYIFIGHWHSGQQNSGLVFVDQSL